MSNFEYFLGRNLVDPRQNLEYSFCTDLVERGQRILVMFLMMKDNDSVYFHGCIRYSHLTGCRGNLSLLVCSGKTQTSSVTQPGSLMKATKYSNRVQVALFV
jgi:hypothetical protein